MVRRIYFTKSSSTDTVSEHYIGDSEARNELNMKNHTVVAVDPYGCMQVWNPCPKGKITSHIRTYIKIMVFKKLLPFGIVEKHETIDQKEGSWIHHGFLNMLL